MLCVSSNFERNGSKIFIENDKLSPIYVIRCSNRINYIVCIGTFIFVSLIVIIYIFSDTKFDVKTNYVELQKVDVLSYDLTKNVMEISVLPSSNQVECYYTNEFNESIIGTIIDNNCVVNVPINSGKIVFINKYDISSTELELTDYVVDIKEKDIYYLPLYKEIELGKDNIVIGNPSISWISLGESVQIVDGKLKAVSVGKSIVKAISNLNVVHEMNVVVTDTIVEMPIKFDKNKQYLPCRHFTEDESKLLDEILAYRIGEAGYQTRAAAVAAARFLTLEFPYRITYFYETGRLDTPGRAKVDGEGRYYHKGLYLSESKFNDLAYIGNGPAIWGCNLRCYEDAPPYFSPGGKYPNGLSCSGFVTWVLYNAGFDVGDIGAGESPYPHQLTDTGKFTSLTDGLIKSGKIKVGDLFNVWGHISILVGEDGNNYYIAESLDTFGGVVINTYSKKRVSDTFPYVVLMDELYKVDGNLTDLWY